jgi:hypothetical protein
VSSREPTLAALLDQALRHHTDGLRVAMPGKIQSFDAATQTADIVPLQKTTDSIDGSDVVTTLPVLSQVPVAFPGGGGYSSTFPVAAGDPCMIVFGDLALDEWYESGDLCTPINLETHGLNGAVAFLGVRAQPKALTEFDTSRAVFGNKGPRVACDGSKIHLGVSHNEAATQSVIRGEAHLAALETLFISISTAIKPIYPVTGAAASTAIDAAINIYKAALHTTPKVKVP